VAKEEEGGMFVARGPWGERGKGAKDGWLKTWRGVTPGHRSAVSREQSDRGQPAHEKKDSGGYRWGDRQTGPRNAETDLGARRRAAA